MMKIPIIKSPIAAVLANKNLTLEMVLSVSYDTVSSPLLSSPVLWVY